MNGAYARNRPDCVKIAVASRTLTGIRHMNLSRSQVAVVPVVTYVDLIAVGGGLLVAALGLLLIGRPYLARRAAARMTVRRRSPDPETEPS